MRIRITLFVGLIAAMALGLATIGTAASGFKVTGGGQTDVGTTGAGDTIAFTAQENPAQGIMGQVQFVDREGGTGKGQVVHHGTVECLVPVSASGSEGAAYMGGDWRDGGTFEIYVEDNGEPNQGNDLIFIDENDPDPSNCDDDSDEEDEPVALGRGNVQVHGTE